MRILLVNQYYLPDRVATAQVLSDLCEHLAAHGHEVYVLCSRHRFDEGAGVSAKLPRRERVGRVLVHRVGGTALGKRRLIGQLIDFACFHLLAAARLLMPGRRYDVVVTLTTPPLIGLWGMIARAVRRTRRHVCWVMNLHPDCEVELGLLGRKAPATRFLDGLDVMSMRRADACVVLGECMARRVLAKGVPQERVEVIPLWAHGVDGPPIAPGDSPLRARWGLEGKFVVMYSGNAGVEYTFDEICAAALALRHDPRFAFVFVGGGRRTAEIVKFRREHGLANIHLHAYRPREELRDSLSAADVHFACLRPELSGVSVPCKLYGIMAVGRPVIFVGAPDGETAHAIRRHDCGFTLDAGDVDGLTNALRTLADDPALRHRLGAASRRAFVAFFNSDRGCAQWTCLLERILIGKRVGKTPHAGRKRQHIFA